MTSLGDRASAASSPLERIDESTAESQLAIADLYEHLRALAMSLEYLNAVLWRQHESHPDEVDAEALSAVDQLLGLLDGQSEPEANVKRKLADRASRGRDAADEFASRLAKHELGNPLGDATYYSSDRSPRHVRKISGVGEGAAKSTTEVIVDRAGRVIGKENTTRRDG